MNPIDHPPVSTIPSDEVLETDGNDVALDVNNNEIDDEETKFPVKKALAVIGLIVIVNIVAWITAGIVYKQYMPNAVALLVVAYTLGLRHALDADHIAAIDNVTRRLVQSKQKPVTVGFFFALGHSTIVIIATMLVAAVSSSIQANFESYGEISGIIGGSISAAFLLLIGIINGVSVYMITRDLKAMRNKKRNDNEKVDWEKMLDNAGFFSRVFGKHLFRVINAPYKMYFVGFLFGLGFDTASEVALLGIAALQAVNGTHTWLILFLPILFTCGMTLLDTTDGILMLGVYGWASITPRKKIYYNLIITVMSAAFAIFIALLQIFGIFQSVYDLSGGFWDFISSAGDNFLAIGVALIASLIAGFILSRILCYYYAPDDDRVSTDIVRDKIHTDDIENDCDSNQITQSESTKNLIDNQYVSPIDLGSINLGVHRAVDDDNFVNNSRISTI
jgi:high-affinity nickel-transport protein